MARRTFLELQNEVLAHGFNDTRYRDRVAQWLNDGFMRAARKVKASGFFDDDSFNTVAGTQRYNLPTNFVRLESVRLTDTDPDEPLRYLELNEAQVSGDYRARPTHYSVVNSQLSLWPLPDSAYPLAISYWTTSAELAPRELAAGEVNLLTNPSFELNANWGNGPNWGVSGAILSQTSADAVYGAKALSIIGALANQGAQASGGILPIDNYTASIWVRSASGSVAGKLHLGDPAVGVTSVAFTATTSWQRVTVTRNFAVAGTGLVNVTLDAAGTLYVDGALLQSGAIVTDYFDGDTEGYEWAGTAHASQSQLSVSSLSGTPSTPEEYDQVAIAYALWKAYTSEHDPEMANYHKNEYGENLMDLGIDLQNPDAHANRQVGGMIEYFKGLT